jgi:hypothetical protein
MDAAGDFCREMSYDDILAELGKGKWQQGQQCHLDPDLRKEILVRDEHWKQAFGQRGRVKDFLDSWNVGEGDLFLFFGRFRQTEFSVDKTLRYVRGAPEQHIIYGYMRVGEILHNDEIDREYHWHPHAGNGDRNNLYLPAEKLYPDSKLHGAGLLTYAPKRVLTKYGMSVSKWELPDFMRGLELRVNTRKEPLTREFHDESNGQSYFQFVGHGQEFVFSVRPGADESRNQKLLEEWAYRMLTDE